MDWRLLHLQIVIFCYTFNLSLDNTKNFESALPYVFTFRAELGNIRR